MAGEEVGKETLEFSNSVAGDSLNLARLRERVKDYIDKVWIIAEIFLPVARIMKINLMSLVFVTLSTFSQFKNMTFYSLGFQNKLKVGLSRVWKTKIKPVPI